MVEEVEFNFGDFVKHKFSEFEGYVVGKAQYFNGCEKLALQGTALHEGRSLPFEWLDVQEVELIKAAEASEAPPPAGGPMQTP